MPRFSTHSSNAKAGPGGFGLRQLTRPDGINGDSGDFIPLIFGRYIVNHGLHMNVVYGLNQRRQINPSK